MKLHVINTGNFKLDGGAMFGVVPKSLWSRTNQPDSNNLCTWAMRSLLIEQDNRLILIDTGIGNKQNEKFFSHFHLHGNDSLKKSINNAGFSIDEITDVFLTHLHFDHCGGSVKWANNEKTHLEPYFKNAIYWSNENHWNWATEPNPREKASFLKENILPLKESGQLKWIKKEDSFTKSVFKNIDVFFADGHTESQMIPIINYKNEKIAFMADLLPSIGHIPLPYVMGYDTRPLITMKEKGFFLDYAYKNNFTLFFEHDPINECCKLKLNEKGIRLDSTHMLKDFL
ncbi:MAG: MBL fold metallo-hydrolase [Crocinitomicaceae bacterium]|nr:MBL fold metallo-hydrolase [Crocinitomicaceae bacterium]